MKDFHSDNITTQHTCTGDVVSGQIVVIAPGYCGIAKTDGKNGDIISLQTRGKVRVGPGAKIAIETSAVTTKGTVAYVNSSGEVTHDDDSASNPVVGRFEKDEYDGGILLLLNA